jgi:cobalamin biosynthesis protein CbiG
MPDPARAVVLGVGMSSTATAGEVRRLAAAVLEEAGRAWSDVERIATLTSLAGDERIAALGFPVVGYEPSELAAVQGLAPNPRTEMAVGTPSVAEAAALLAAGPHGRLVRPKRRAERVTAALARRP